MNNLPLTFIFVVEPEEEERFGDGLLLELHRRYTILLKKENEKKLIVFTGGDYSVFQMALQLGGLNIHMSKHPKPEVLYRISALCPNHSGLKKSL